VQEFALSVVPGQPCSLIRFYTVARLTSKFVLISPILIMDSPENGSWPSPFYKFSRLKNNIFA
jgi:hypothetical protein